MWAASSRRARPRICWRSQHPYTEALLSVVPESRRMEQQILEGETPDAARIPDGCRFHPRLPGRASGEAERLGILDRCLHVDPSLEWTGPRAVACHLTHRTRDPERQF
ncbi:MAG: hypothetical protein R2710_07695 [Acidimicrobiales bacterium]